MGIRVSIVAHGPFVKGCCYKAACRKKTVLYYKEFGALKIAPCLKAVCAEQRPIAKSSLTIVVSFCFTNYAQRRLIKHQKETNKEEIQNVNIDLCLKYKLVFIKNGM